MIGVGFCLMCFLVKLFDFVYHSIWQEYALLFDGAGSGPGEKTLEDKFFEYEVRSYLILDNRL